MDWWLVMCAVASFIHTHVFMHGNLYRDEYENFTAFKEKNQVRNLLN